jgi:hypothetical protein
MWALSRYENLNGVNLMAKIIITKDNLVSSNEFLVLLELLESRSSPMEKVLDLLRTLIVFERKYKIASDVFYARFMRGKMGDAIPFIEWAGKYELYLEAKHEVESKLTSIPEFSDVEEVPIPIV